MVKYLKYSIPAAALLLAACTVGSGQNGLETQLHPPLFYPQWSSKSYTTSNGIPVCAISSGNNGITVTVGKTATGLDTVVQSTRLMQPGATFTINANGGNFQTSDTFFPPSVTPGLVDALGKGGKAYLEWSEFSGSSARERVHMQNILQLDDFSVRLQECRASLSR